MLGPSYQRPTWLLLPLLLLMAASLGLQFTSTRLLMDLGDGNVPSIPTTTPIPLGYVGRTYNDVDYAGSPPRAYPPFAEWASGALRSYEALDYTGASVRAFLPYTSQTDLMSVREVSSSAALINISTLCASPSIQDAIFSRGPEQYSFHLNITFDVPTFKQQLHANGFDANEFFEHRFDETGNPDQYSPSSPPPGFDGTISCIIACQSLAGVLDSCLLILLLRHAAVFRLL